jgi:four helix bundle protein
MGLREPVKVNLNRPRACSLCAFCAFLWLCLSSYEKSRFSRDYGLKDQTTRAAVSIMSNIAEGFERGSNKEFIQFLFIAKGSAGEVCSQLYVCLDRKYITQQDFDQAVGLVKQISGYLMKLIGYLKGAKLTGIKHKKPA